MKRSILAAASAVMIAGFVALVGAETKPVMTGEELFKEHCAFCHADGGNIINPAKTLRKADLKAHGIMTKADIIEKMRHPGKGMTTWSAATLPDDKAGLIADYILKTFK
jgi:cytochrome c6